MGFLIRMAFWFSLVLLALPLGSNADGTSVSPLQALLAAREAVSDVAGICERKPDVCVTGKEAMHTIGVRAREGARMAFEALDENFGEQQKPGEQQMLAGQDTTVTGGIPVPTPAMRPQVDVAPAQTAN